MAALSHPERVANLYPSIASGLFDSGEQDKALELLDKAGSAADEIEHSEEKIRALCDVGSGFLEAKRNDKAIETFDKARVNAENLDNVHRDVLLSAISLGFMRAGSVDLADRTLDSIADKTQIANTLLGFSRELWRKDEQTEALEALDEAYAIVRSQREKETRDSKAKFAVFSAIAVQFARFEKGERAIGIAQEIPDENEQMKALGQIGQILTIQEHNELAAQAIQAIPEDSHRMFALVSLSDAADQKRSREMAESFLEEAAVLAETVPQLASRTSVYVELAERFQKFGRTDQAREISHTNLETIATIRDESTRAVSLANLSELYAAADFDTMPNEREILQQLIQKADMG